MERPLEFTIRSVRPELIEMVREYASHRLSFALRRFDGRIRRVTVRVVDQNGPKRGVDWRCSMSAELVDGREIFVEATTPWPFSSVTLASGRLREAVRRQLGRLVTHRHQPLATHGGFRM